MADIKESLGKNSWWIAILALVLVVFVAWRFHEHAMAEAAKAHGPEGIGLMPKLGNGDDNTLIAR